MLIFFLDVDPTVAASYVPNGHMKLAIECGQLFRAAMWHHQADGSKKPGYVNHPFTLWIRDSEWAWDWLMRFAEALSCHEYPKRYAENAKKRKRPYHGAWYTIQETVVKPANFTYRTKTETPLCPLPHAMQNAEPVSMHEERAFQFRMYHVLYKNHKEKRFLFEPRTRRPYYMPPRTPLQEELVQQNRKRLKLC